MSVSASIHEWSTTDLLVAISQKGRRGDEAWHEILYRDKRRGELSDELEAFEVAVMALMRSSMCSDIPYPLPGTPLAKLYALMPAAAEDGEN